MNIPQVKTEEQARAVLATLGLEAKEFHLSFSESTLGFYKHGKLVGWGAELYGERFNLVKVLNRFIAKNWQPLHPPFTPIQQTHITKICEGADG